jgi:hypothetical protein
MSNSAYYFAFSFKNSEIGVYEELIHTWEEVADELGDIENLQIGLLFQPHPVTNGTNSLGLAPNETDLVLAALTGSYSNKADDDTVLNALEAILAKSEEYLQQEGLLIPYKYLNYAYKTQDPIGSYGEDIKAQLQKVSEKYDPLGFFQTVQPGGFKLF